MPRKFNSQLSSGFTILLVDDDPEYLEAARLLLEREGHHVQAVDSGTAALERLDQMPIDLLLLDYYMPGMTGEQVVTELRRTNPYVQVVLQTGYASEQPPRELLTRLDIQGYYDKSEGPEKLLLWTDVGLRAAFTLHRLTKSRQGLRYVLNVTPALHKIQPLDDLFRTILSQLTGLMSVADSFSVRRRSGPGPSAATESRAFLATWNDNEWVIRAQIGGDVPDAPGHIRNAEAARLTAAQAALDRGEIQFDDRSTILPLRFGDLTIGAVYVDRSVANDEDTELLQIFANQAAVAIENMQLYEMATMDPLTGVYTRRLFDQWLLRSLRTAFRSRHELALLMLDLDNLKQINDIAGHLVGDQALSGLGAVLREAMRSSDVFGRYGGDEFAVILTQTCETEAERVAERILDLLSKRTVTGATGRITVRASIGISKLMPYDADSAENRKPVPDSYFEDMAQNLLQLADQALYQAKGKGGNRVCRSDTLKWPPPP